MREICWYSSNDGAGNICIMQLLLMTTEGSYEDEKLRNYPRNNGCPRISFRHPLFIRHGDRIELWYPRTHPWRMLLYGLLKLYLKDIRVADISVTEAMRNVFGHPFRSPPRKLPWRTSKTYVCPDPSAEGSVTCIRIITLSGNFRGNIRGGMIFDIRSGVVRGNFLDGCPNHMSSRIPYPDC